MQEKKKDKEMEWQERDEVMKIGEEQDIVIVGGGICGLATALLFTGSPLPPPLLLLTPRFLSFFFVFLVVFPPFFWIKGIKSIVLERSETLRAAGVRIIMQPNGWRALDQLCVASKLWETAIDIPSRQLITVDDGKRHELSLGKGELRCLKRMDLVKALAEPLPEDTVHLGC
ncbi:hypothetical protein CRYUN_Cryun28dG0010100 [Craigia yunnanensis]